MHINVELLQYIIAILAGVLILAQPRLLNTIVAVYLIIIGIMGVLRIMGIT